MNWVEIESFWSLEEAELAASLLKANQVPCRLDGTAVAGNFWYLSNATGGVKLMVAPEAVDQANQLLHEVDVRKSGDRADDNAAEADAEQLETEPSSAPDQTEDFESDTDAADQYDSPDHDDADDDRTDRPSVLSRLRDQRGWLLLIIVWPAIALAGAALVALLDMIAE